MYVNNIVDFVLFCIIMQLHNKIKYIKNMEADNRPETRGTELTRNMARNIINMLKTIRDTHVAPNRQDSTQVVVMKNNHSGKFEVDDEEINCNTVRSIYLMTNDLMPVDLPVIKNILNNYNNIGKLELYLDHDLSQTGIQSIVRCLKDDVAIHTLNIQTYNVEGDNFRLLLESINTLNDLSCNINLQTPMLPDGCLNDLEIDLLAKSPISRFSSNTNFTNQDTDVKLLKSLLDYNSEMQHLSLGSGRFSLDGYDYDVETINDILYYLTENKCLTVYERSISDEEKFIEAWNTGEALEDLKSWGAFNIRSTNNQLEGVEHIKRYNPNFDIFTPVTNETEETVWSFSNFYILHENPQQTLAKAPFVDSDVLAIGDSIDM
ncbi:MAG: hypothetical protein DGJ47_000404 [Rickettsiaceae bacterium]